jgi:hypothetical protein
MFRLTEQNTAGEIILNTAECRSDTRKYAGVDVVLLWVLRTRHQVSCTLLFHVSQVGPSAGLVW